MPHFQHHTTPRAAASECVWCATRRPLPMNPENSRGAKDLDVQRTRLILVFNVSLTLGRGHEGGRAISARGTTSSVKTRLENQVGSAISSSDMCPSLSEQSKADGRGGTTPWPTARTGRAAKLSPISRATACPSTVVVTVAPCRAWPSVDKLASLARLAISERRASAAALFSAIAALCSGPSSGPAGGTLREGDRRGCSAMRARFNNASCRLISMKRFWAAVIPLERTSELLAELVVAVWFV